MWVSNTAVATMMLPIALAVGEKFRPSQHGQDDQHDQNNQHDQYNFGIGLMLGIAYGASIGGVATLIGTPPNAILAAAAQELRGIQIGFVEWMSVGLPMTLVLLPLAWLLLVRVLYPPERLSADVAGLLQTEQANLGSVGRGRRLSEPSLL
jgi:sodium-dependent dicarboxylate transporter 2/3/5